MRSPFRLNVTGTTNINTNVESSYNIYPNPVRDILYINGDIGKLLGVKIIAPNGEIVAETSDYAGKGMSVSSLADGTYVVVLETEYGTIVKKMLKIE